MLLNSLQHSLFCLTYFDKLVDAILNEYAFERGEMPGILQLPEPGTEHIGQQIARPVHRGAQYVAHP